MSKVKRQKIILLAMMSLSMSLRAEVKRFSGNDIYQVQHNGARVLIDACTASGDCSNESRLKIADAFCHSKGFDMADDYSLDDFKPGYHKKRTGDRSNIYNDFYLSSCEFQEAKRRKITSCSWILKKFKNTKSATYFSSFSCMNNNDHDQP